MANNDAMPNILAFIEEAKAKKAKKAGVAAAKL
jgi:hypothetical protein